MSPLLSTTDPVAQDAPPADVPVLRRAAMDYLARREHSFFELKQKMYQRFESVSPETLDGVLDSLRAENLQSDERFTDSYVRYRKNRGFAYQHIRGELLQRRVNTELIEKYLVRDDEAWGELLEQLIERRLGHDTTIQFGSREHRKILRFLEARGFFQQDIGSALRSRLVC